MPELNDGYDSLNGDVMREMAADLSFGSGCDKGEAIRR